MRRLHRPLFALAAIAAAAVTLVPPTAQAARRHHHRVVTAPSEHALTVRRRPFTDTGTIVPVGSEKKYVDDTRRGSLTPDHYFAPGRYGNETLPGAFDLPGFSRY